MEIMKLSAVLYCIRWGEYPGEAIPSNMAPFSFVIEDAGMKLVREVLVVLPPGMELLR